MADERTTWPVRTAMVVFAVLVAGVLGYLVFVVVVSEGLSSRNQEANERAAANADEQASSLSVALTGLPPGSPVTRDVVAEAARVRTAEVRRFTGDDGRVVALVEVHGVTSGPIGGVEAVKCFRFSIDPSQRPVGVDYAEVARKDCATPAS